MKHRVLTPLDEQPLLFDRPESFLLLMQAACAVGLAYPSPADAKWFERLFVEEYTGDKYFWHPYAMAGGSVVVKPWASAAFNYVGRYVSGKGTLAILDPTRWRENFANLVSDVSYMDPAIRARLQQMEDDYLEPQDVAYRDAFELRVRQAVSMGSIVVSPRNAKKLMGAA